MRALSKKLVLLAAFLAAAPAAAQRLDAPQPQLPLEPLAIETAAGDVWRFTVEMAVEPIQQQIGLMHRTEMPLDRGMLFVFPAEEPRAFWTMNTLLSLDMVFIAADGEIVSIARRTPVFDPVEGPHSFGSGAPALAVLEINGGMTEELGVNPGDRVVHPAFETASEAAESEPDAPGTTAPGEEAE